MMALGHQDRTVSAIVSDINAVGALPIANKDRSVERVAHLEVVNESPAWARPTCRCGGFPSAAGAAGRVRSLGRGGVGRANGHPSLPRGRVRQPPLWRLRYGDVARPWVARGRAKLSASGGPAATNDLLYQMI